MALLKRTLVNTVDTTVRRPLVKAPVQVPARTSRGREKVAARSVTVRLPDSHIAMLEHVIKVGECDRSEAIKRGIRQLYQAYTAKDASLMLTAADGTKSTVPIMIKGLPC